MLLNPAKLIHKIVTVIAVAYCKLRKSNISEETDIKRHIL
jgi:hypothetical protein